MTTTIQEYSATESALADLAQRFKGVVFDVTTKQGMEDAKKGRAELRTYRTDLEKMRKEIKAPALLRCNQIDSEAKRITLELESLEDPIADFRAIALQNLVAGQALPLAPILFHQPGIEHGIFQPQRFRRLPLR